MRLSEVRRTARCVTLAFVSAGTRGVKSMYHSRPAFTQVRRQSYKSTSSRAEPRPCHGVLPKNAIFSIWCAMIVTPQEKVFDCDGGCWVMRRLDGTSRGTSASERGGGWFHRVVS